MKFNQLSEASKEQALDQLRFECCDHFSVSELLDYLNDKLESEYCVRIYEISDYDLYGRELHIDFELKVGFLKENIKNFTRAEYLVLKNQLGDSFSAKWWNNSINGGSVLEEVSCIYCNETTDYCSCSEKGFITTDKNIDYVVEDANSSFASLFNDICFEIWTILNNAYKDYSSDEYVREHIEENDFDFDENGKLL